MSRERRAWAITFGAVAAGAVAPLVVVLASGHTPAWRDSARLFAPLRPLVADALRSFHLPLWNPYEALGLPLFAQMMHGVLHPASIALAFVAPKAGIDWLLVVHVALAAVGASVAARVLGTSPGASAVAGFAYGLSGYVLSMTSNAQYLAAAATAPWAIAALARVRDGRSVAIAALAVTALHFAGDPQWVLVATLIGVVLAASGRKPAALAVAAVAIGTAVAAVQLLPTWTYLQSSSRDASALSEGERAHWALAPWRLVELVAPGFFSGVIGETYDAPVYVKLGHPSVALDTFANYFVMPFVSSVFVGAAVLWLAASGAREKIGRALAGICVVTLWLALGAYAGSEQLLHRVPVWGSFRYAEKLVGPFTLCLALLAALGADRLATRRARTALIAAAVCAALAIGLGAGAGTSLFSAAADVAPYARWRLAVGLYHAGGALAALALVLRLWRTPWAAAGLVFAEGCAAAMFALHPGSKAAVPDHSLHGLEAEWGVVRVVSPLPGLVIRKRLGLDSLDGQIGLDARLGLPPFGIGDRIDHLQTYTGFAPLQAMRLGATFGSDFRAMRRLALTHVVVRDPIGSIERERIAPALDGGRLVLDDREWMFTVWEVPHRPWAFFARSAWMVDNEDDALRGLVEGIREAGKPDVVLEGPVPKGLAAGNVLRVDRRAEIVEIEAESDGDGLLVVTDSYWPGWTALIDGAPVQIQRADAGLRAVRWPRGRHTVLMRYHPPEVRLGIKITAAGGLAILALAFVRRKKQNADAEIAPPREAAGCDTVARRVLS
jgi:hypothetical protein